MLLPETERALVHRVATAQREGRAPSLTAAVVRDGERAWSHAIESTTDTQFRIGSLTKTFVAVLVMRLRDAGRLSLDDPIETHLADVPVRGLTIGQLLSHTAGLLSEYAEEGEALEQPGERLALLDSSGAHVGTVEVTDVDVMPFGDVPWSFARAEGEGDADREEWRAGHRRFWEGEGTPVTDETSVVCVRFELREAGSRAQERSWR